MLLPRSSGATLSLGALIVFILGSVAQAKIYDRCELARELHDRFKFSKRDLDKWLCLAYWESRFDTRAYHKGRFDGSGDHGIFQINDKYWCQPYTGYSENVCKVPCYMLRDDNLEDDIQCVNKIFRRHGFHAWMMFTHKCSGNTLEFFNGCDIKSRKGTLPSRYEAQASSISRSIVKPNRTMVEDMEPSASSHERYHASEESIHNVGGDFSQLTSSQGHSSSSASAASLGYGASAYVQSPVSSTLYRQVSPGSLSQSSGLHLGSSGLIGGASINGQNVFLSGSQGLTSSFSSPLSSSGLSSSFGLGSSSAFGGSPLSFGGSDLSLLSSSQLLTPQSSQLSPMVHHHHHPMHAPGPAAAKPKPGVIQRLQGALRPPFRVPFRTSGRSGAPAGSGQAPTSLLGAPLISGYGSPILLPFNRLANRGIGKSGAGVHKRQGAGATRKPQSSANSSRPVDPLIAALNAPFPSSKNKSRKPTTQSSASDEDEDEDDDKKKKKKK